MSLEVTDPHPVERAQEILTPEALAFVEALHQRFARRRDDLLVARDDRRDEIARTGRLDFLPETRQVRQSDWKVAPAPEALRDRRVEMTGPAVPAKMAINALNSGANVWLADLEDASCPTWPNVVSSILNLRDGAQGTLSFTNEDGREYRLRTDAPLAVVVTRPRGWHLDEAHVLIDGRRAVGSLVDFGLHFFHLARLLIDGGRGPYYYLPKMESHLEARLWNDVFTFAQAELGIPHGTIRATVLIETIPAAFQMDEILYELRDHAAGLNAGRWDYLFSVIKYFRDAGPDFVLVDRGDITMRAPFMRAYTELLVKTCHRRGAYAMGGMAAFIPSQDPEANATAFEKVRADKAREAGDGFDGSWVAHPGLVSLCREVFDGVLGDRPHQLDRLREEVTVTSADLLDVRSAPGSNTETGLRNNVYVALAYTAVWLSGNGAVAIHNQMEDAATAEISRSQIWQLIANQTVLSDTGEPVTRELVSALLAEESERLRAAVSAETFAHYYEP
ncbi:MAG: malate synthase A, partial [Lapillicoccus sp.]